MKKINVTLLFIAAMLLSMTTVFSKANNLAMDLDANKKSENSIGESKTSPKDKFFIGLFPGLNLSAASTDSKGMSFSPQFDIRPEYLFKKHFGVFADLGYQQSRYEFSKTLMREDFFRTAVYFRYHYAIKKFKLILPFVYSGLYQKTRISSEFEVLSNKKIYSADDYTPSFSMGASIGLGLEFNILKLFVPIATVSFHKSFTDRITKVNSDAVELKASGDYSIEFALGVKLRIK